MMDRTAWDKALHKYELAELLEKANQEFGPEFQINEKYIRLEWSLESKHGKRPAISDGSAAAKAFHELGLQREREIEALTPIYYDPTLLAAQELAQTPAPDIAAVRLKCELINRLDLECYADTENIFDVVQADIERLAA